MEVDSRVTRVDNQAQEKRLLKGMTQQVGHHREGHQDRLSRSPLGSSDQIRQSHHLHPLRTLPETMEHCARRSLSTISYGY